MSPVRLSVIIPVFNGANCIRLVLERVASALVSLPQAKRVATDLVVVDDDSQDESCHQIELFQRASPQIPLHLIRHTRPVGRGAAIRTAIEHAQGELCIIQPADLNYDPADCQKLLEPLLTDQADVVLGSRLMNSIHRRPLSLWEDAANRFISGVCSVTCGLALSDVMSGYKAFRTAQARSIPLYSNGFGFDAEFIAQFVRRHARFVEVPVIYRALREHNRYAGFSAVPAAIAGTLRARLLSPSDRDVPTDMLVSMSRARHFNRWMADVIKPWITGEALELGAGIGNLTLFLAAQPDRYTATDTEQEHLLELHARTAALPNVRLQRCDLSSREDILPLQQSADTVICLNVLEHVLDDVAGLANIHSCLRSGGTAIILVPQGPEAFGALDEVLDHKRRYTRLDLHEKMAAVGFQVVEMLDFNHATFPAWYLNSRLLRRRTLGRMQLRIFNLFVPLIKHIDHRLPWPPTSLIAIGVAH